MLKGDSDFKGKEEATPLPQEQQKGSHSSQHETAGAQPGDSGQQSKLGTVGNRAKAKEP